MLDDQADQLLDKALYRGLILIGVFFAGVLICLITARLLFRGKESTRDGTTAQP